MLARSAHTPESRISDPTLQGSRAVTWLHQCLAVMTECRRYQPSWQCRSATREEEHEQEEGGEQDDGRKHAPSPCRTDPMLAQVWKGHFGNMGQRDRQFARAHSPPIGRTSRLGSRYYSGTLIFGALEHAPVAGGAAAGLDKACTCPASHEFSLQLLLCIRLSWNQHSLQSLVTFALHTRLCLMRNHAVESCSPRVRSLVRIAGFG